MPPNDNCPNPKGPDWDFAQGPMLFSGKDEDVTVNVPLEAAAEVIRPDGRIYPAAAIRGLRYARFQTLVEVRDGDDHVKVSLW